MCRSLRPVIGLFCLAYYLMGCGTSKNNIDEYLDTGDTGDSEISDDMDGDGVLTEEDCNDNDANSTIVAEDADCDGAPDQYDCEPADPEIGFGAPSSFLKLEEWDRDLNGGIARTRTFTYDENGVLENISVQWSSSGFDEVYQNSYNENGQLISHEFFLDGEFVWEWNYSYDENGRELSTEKFRANSSGSTFLKEGHYYSYDEAGNILIYEQANDGMLIDRREENTYEVNGVLIMTEVDTNADGTIDEAIYYTYTNEGLLLKEIDEGLDETIDVTYTYSYDSNGNIETIEVFASGAVEDEYLGTVEVVDGPIEFSTLYIYDSEGRLISLEKVWQDGSVLFGKYYTYEHNGLRFWQETFEDGEQLSERFAFTYYADCEMTWAE